MAKIARRDLLKALGGGAAGLFLTPVPWKLIDDTAKWTQNWRWIPRTPRGEVKVRYTNCGLCPAGCAVRARCIGDYPISLSGVAAHPLSRGALCPLGIAGHHIAFHPSRLKGPVRRKGGEDANSFESVKRDAAMRELAEAVVRAGRSERAIAVIDEAPGRVTSASYRQFVGENGFYIAPQREDEALEALARSFVQPVGSLGIDVENARMIVSFGAPLLENWSTPGRAASLLQKRTTQTPGERIRIVQVEAALSATGSLADEWLAIEPGTEAALALGLAHVLVGEKLYDKATVREALDFDGSAGFAARVAQFTPEYTRSITGISEQTIVTVARDMAANGPAVAIGGSAGAPLGPEAAGAVAALNLLLGSVGKPGGIVVRTGFAQASSAQPLNPAPDAIASITDGSIGVLILGDATSGNSIGWAQLEHKLAEGAVVVSLSPFFEGLARHAHLCIPAAGYLSALQDVPAPPAAPFSTFSISTPLMPAPAASTDPVALISALATELKVAGEFPASTEEALKRRVSDIFKNGRGRLVAYSSGEATPVKSVKSAEDFWKAIGDGACWVDDPSALRPVHIGRYRFASAKPLPRGKESQAGRDAAYPLVMVSEASPSAGNERVCPLMNKLYRESDLRLNARTVALNPATAASRGISDGDRVLIETPGSSAGAVARLREGVRPGVLRTGAPLPGGPPNQAAGATPARIRKAEHA